MRLAVWTLAGLVAIMLGYLVFDQWWPSGHGALVVTSDPPGAQIWVDLKPTSATTNGRLKSLSVGNHSVMVKLDTLEPDPTAQVVQVRSGKTDSVHFRLFAPHGDHQKVAALADKLPDLPPVGQIPPASPPPSPEPSRIATPIDTASRASLNSPETGPQNIAQNSTEPSEAAEPPTATGVLEIATSVPGAAIFVNDRELTERTPTSTQLPPGSYKVRVQLDGYTSDPADQVVRIRRKSALQSAYFTLLAEVTDHEISVETSPFAGKIFVNGELAGEGSLTVNRDYGSYTVTFGDSDGWRTPAPVQVAVTPSQPHPSARGVYTRLFRASAEASGKKAVFEGSVRAQTGVFFEDEGPNPSSLGPKIRPIPGSSKSGWELGEGDPNRNPTGGDYVEFTFNLPPDLDLKAPRTLRMYLYRSNKRYAFSLSGRSEVVVAVNGRVFLDGFRPAFGTEAADEGRFEEWSLDGMLVRGPNRVLVRSGERNSLLNYLWKVEIR